MSLVIFLDAGPLGLVTNPRAESENLECARWLEALLAAGVRAVVPEIADYEVRRELIRVNRLRGIARLDTMKQTIGYVPLTTEAMLLAVQFWAEPRRRGRPTADDRALDGDVILAAQAVVAARGGDEVVIATTNVSHLSQFTDARAWREIRPTELHDGPASAPP